MTRHAIDTVRACARGTSARCTVSVVGLGCNNFGGRIDEAATRAVVDAALDVGVTFFDTADIYGNHGGSEELLGRVLRGRRDQVVLATKFGKEMGDGAERRGTRSYIRAALDASLQRLQTERRRPLPAPRGGHRDAARGDDRRARRARRRRARFAPSAPRTTSRDPRARQGDRARPPYVSEQSEYSWLRARGRSRGDSGLRTARARLHPVLPARERPAHRQGLARRSAGRGHAVCTAGRSTTPISTASSG